MPSIGSTIQTTPAGARALARPPRRPCPSSGRAPRSRSRTSASAGPVGLGDDVDGAGLRAGDLDPLGSAAGRSARRPRGRWRGRGRAGLRGSGRSRGHAAGSTPSGSTPGQLAERGQRARGLGQQPAAHRSQHGRPAADRGPVDRLAALDRGPLDEQVAHHRHEPGVGARRRHPDGVQARAARRSPAPRCRGRRRPPCGRRRTRSGPARPSSTPSPASFSRWSLTSGSSHGTWGGPEREQNTRSWSWRRPVDLGDPVGDVRRGVAVLGEVGAALGPAAVVHRRRGSSG